MNDHEDERPEVGYRLQEVTVDGAPILPRIYPSRAEAMAAGAAHGARVAQLESAQAQESIELAAVSAKGEDDPNRDWASATPTGHLTMTIQNPEAWGYVVPGAQYRVTIERIRGPRGG